MSIFRNLAAAFVPVRERRESSGTLSANGAEVVHDCNGDEAALIYLNAGAPTWNATYAIEGSADGTNYFALPAYPFVPGCNGGTIPHAAQPLLTEAINTTNVFRALCVNVGQVRKLRIRLSAWTSGSAAVTINSEAQASLHPNVLAQKTGSLLQSAVSASAGAAITATLPAVAGLRHYIDFIRVTRSATAALTASATPVNVTTTNLPGSPILTFGSDAAGIGIDKFDELDFGSSGMGASVVNTATAVVCPAYTGVIWRINVGYRLGL